ncbi:MAG: TetR/AcrR family transcriptional regulator [bacterium]
MKSLMLEAAMELYLSKGIENVTIRNIADKIEFSPATIYLYFKDKDEIFFHLYNLAFGKFYQAQLRDESIVDPWERLQKSGMHYIEWALANPKLYDLMFILEIPMDVIAESSCVDIGINSYNLLKKTVAECIGRDSIKVSDPDLGAMIFWNYVHGIVSLLIKKRVLYPAEHVSRLIDAMLATFYSAMQK